jgi:hypothetical protein
MDEQRKKLFFESVDKMCSAKHLEGLAETAKKLYESTLEPNETTINQVDLNKLPDESINELQGDMAKVAEAKKSADEANKNLTEVNAEVAAKANAASEQAEQQDGTEQPPEA